MKDLLLIIAEIQALAQAGLWYAKDEFDKERYQRFLEISADLGSDISGVDYKQVLGLFAAEEGYRTPKVDVRGAVFQNGKILLVKEKDDNLWSLPGGWADVNLSPSKNILNEIKEESGYECRVIKLIGAIDKTRKNPQTGWPHIYTMLFLCEIIDECSFEESAEVSEIGFFGQDELPDLSKERVTEEQVIRCFVHLHNSSLHADFD